VTDLEITRLCAEAMGYEIDYSETNGGGRGNTGFDILGAAVLDWHNNVTFNPLHDDEQAMALVKRFDPILEPDGYIPEGETLWAVTIPSSRNEKGKKTKTTVVRQTYDLNRAICECVAKMQAAK